MLNWVSERVPESATRRLRADRLRQTRDTPANATIGISGGISLQYIVWLLSTSKSYRMSELEDNEAKRRPHGGLDPRLV